MKTWILHACVFLAGAGLAAFAVPTDRGAKGHGIDAVYAELGLSQAVEPEMKKLSAAVGPECRSLGEKRRALYAELQKEPCDRAAVDRLAAEITETRARIQKHVVDHLIAVRPLLTPAQREKLFARLAGDPEKR
ncbi:MAG: hypothetical protein FD180_4315 [Planctomycetota bacterium]|nr:MAG: hypothetical protein FD180_4315 [Planctomycetota bacterium]